MTSVNPFCEAGGPSHAKWKAWDLLLWKIWPERLGGGRPHLTAYKDAWVRYNKLRILSLAHKHEIPASLLAGIAWEEAGGMPDVVDRVAFPIRSFDWSGPDWTDQMSVTRHPLKTSVGSVSIQLSAAAREMGINPENLTYIQQTQLIECLETDAFNLDVVAQHIRRLIGHDYPGRTTSQLNDEHWAVVGSRYNRGTARDLEDILKSLASPPNAAGRQYSEYGRALLRRRPHIERLMQTP